MLREDLINSLCDFVEANNYQQLHGNFEAIDDDGNVAGEIDALFLGNRRYVISHLDEETNVLRVTFKDSEIGVQRAFMGPMVANEDRERIVNEIMERVLS